MPESFRYEIRNENLDPKDWILLRLLQEDARMSYAELGRQAGLSPPAAAERVRRLEDTGLITGYHAALNPKHLGLPIRVIIEIQVKKPDYPRFQKAVQGLAWITECHHITGRSAFVLTAVAPSVEGLESLIGHLSQYGETTTSLVMSTVVARRVFTV